MSVLTLQGVSFGGKALKLGGHLLAGASRTLGRESGEAIGLLTGKLAGGLKGGLSRSLTMGLNNSLTKGLSSGIKGIGSQVRCAGHVVVRASCKTLLRADSESIFLQYNCLAAAGWTLRLLTLLRAPVPQSIRMLKGAASGAALAYKLGDTPAMRIVRMQRERLIRLAKHVKSILTRTFPSPFQLVSNALTTYLRQTMIDSLKTFLLVKCSPLFDHAMQVRRRGAASAH